MNKLLVKAKFIVFKKKINSNDDHEKRISVADVRLKVKSLHTGHYGEKFYILNKNSLISISLIKGLLP